MITLYYITIMIAECLKVIKSKKPITKFHDEIEMVRKGEYLKLIREKIKLNPDSLIGNQELKTVDNDIDRNKLMDAGMYLGSFVRLLKKEYEDMSDVKLSICTQITLFELYLKIYANKNGLSNQGDSLNDVIHQIGIHKGMTVEEIEIVQKGTKIIEMVKRPDVYSGEWVEAEASFKIAEGLTNKYNLKVV